MPRTGFMLAGSSWIKGSHELAIYNSEGIIRTSTLIWTLTPPEVSGIVVCFLQIPKENQRGAQHKTIFFNQLISALASHHSRVVELVCSFIFADRKLRPLKLKFNVVWMKDTCVN